MANYSGGKLPNLILEQSVAPVWLLNRDIYQEAINTQFLSVREDLIFPIRPGSSLTGSGKRQRPSSRTRRRSIRGWDTAGR